MRPSEFWPRLPQAEKIGSLECKDAAGGRVTFFKLGTASLFSLVISVFFAYVREAGLVCVDQVSRKTGMIARVPEKRASDRPTKKNWAIQHRPIESSINGLEKLVVQIEGQLESFFFTDDEIQGG